MPPEEPQHDDVGVGFLLDSHLMTGFNLNLAWRSGICTMSGMCWMSVMTMRLAV